MTAGCDRRRLQTVGTAVLLATLPLVVAAAPPWTAARPPGDRPTTAASAVAGSAPVPPATAPGDAPGLSVELTAMTPSALEPGTPVELQGLVTNVDDHVWRQARAYLVISPSPLTTRTELAATGASPPGSYFGDRIIDEGLFARLGGLDPGEVEPFRLEVPWRNLDISGVPGVYTAGVHVLATDTDDSRPTEGRARTFVPLVDDRVTAVIRTALVWPLDAVVLRRANGTYARVGRTVRVMSPAGRLRRLVDLGRTSGPVPLTVVPDPAVLEAAADIGSGIFGPPGGTPASRPDPGGSEAVVSWLDDTLDLLAASTPWQTGYGEPAVDTLAAADRPALTRATVAAGRAVRNQLLTGRERTMHLPPRGVVAGSSLGWLRGPDGDGAVALAPQVLPGWDPVEGAALTVSTGAGPLDVVVADPALAAGGPAPGDPRSALQVRQRLLAETALLGVEAAVAGRASTTAAFVTPDKWDPGPDWPSSNFFAGLDVPWLEPVPLDEVVAAPRAYRGRAGGGDPVADPVSSTLVTAAAELGARVRVLTRLVDGGPPLTRWYDAAVALGVSEAARRDEAYRLRLTERTTASVRRSLRDVTITGPKFVTLSSSQGRFPLTVTNRLDRTVTVSVAIRTDTDADTTDAEPVTGARFDTGDPLTIRPGGSDTVTVRARVGKAGVTSARAYLVTESGRRLGDPLVFSLRTSVVGTVIWAIMGLACAVLVVAIARRLVRRARGGYVPGLTR